MVQQKTHYRVLRSTVVLAKSSAAIRQIATPDLQQAITDAQAKNYQFEQIDPIMLERLYVAFDEPFTKRVRDEFTFFPKIGSVRVHAEAIGVCELCGKGDSKETGDNKDHLRIEYLLTNTAGGADHWCGSTCIINFGLKVDGASTAAEAERLLGQSMRQAVRQFEINAWRAEHGDHADMPAQYQELRGLVSYAVHVGRQHFGELLLAGIDVSTLRREAHDISGRLKTAVGFYRREGYLTPKKTPDWENAKRALSTLKEARRVLDSGLNLTDGYERFEHFLRAGNGTGKEL